MTELGSNLLRQDKEEGSLVKGGFQMKKAWPIVVLIIILVLAGVGLGIFFLAPEWLPFEVKSREKMASPVVSSAEKESAGESDYRAVFLTNNQVYFGKLTREEKAYAVLTDVYYLRLRQSLQEQKTEEGKEGEPVPTPVLQQELTLIKLGNELHGPIDEIKINKDHILFIENLKQDGQVVKAIEEYKRQQ